MTPPEIASVPAVASSTRLDVDRPAAQQAWEDAQERVRSAQREARRNPCEATLQALRVARAFEEATHREVDRLHQVASRADADSERDRAPVAEGRERL